MFCSRDSPPARQRAASFPMTGPPLTVIVCLAIALGWNRSVRVQGFSLSPSALQQRPRYPAPPRKASILETSHDTFARSARDCDDDVYRPQQRWRRTAARLSATPTTLASDSAEYLRNKEDLKKVMWSQYILPIRLLYQQHQL